MRINSIIPRFTEETPSQLEEGILYISEKYDVAIHLCACGCKDKSVTPLKMVAGIPGWTLKKNGDLVSLTPSIGNWSGEKQGYHAHYYITDNKINWC